MSATIEQVTNLASETPEEQVRWRGQMDKFGKPVFKDGQPLRLAFITARYVQDSLDENVGPENWRVRYEDIPNTRAVRCYIAINIEGEWVEKGDVGVPSNIEPEKGAHSDAFKRAGVLWGIARDLYDERDDRESAPAAPVAETRQPRPRRPLREVVHSADDAEYDDEQADGEWFCPVHDQSKVVPAGVSKRTNKAYKAFYACPVSGCDQKGPSL